MRLFSGSGRPARLATVVCAAIALPALALPFLTVPSDERVRSWPVEKPPPYDLPGLVLPDISNLPREKCVTVPIVEKDPTMRVLTVEVDAAGAVRLTGIRFCALSAWRGVNLPIQQDNRTPPLLDTIPLRVRRAPRSCSGVTFENHRWRTEDFSVLADKLAELSQIGEVPVVVDADADLPFGTIAGLTYAASSQGLPVEFKPTFENWKTASFLEAPFLKPLAVRLIRTSVRHRTCECWPAVGVVIRADARARWGDVQKMMLACADARASIWMVSFAVVEDGRETTVGNYEAKPRHARERSPGRIYSPSSGYRGEVPQPDEEEYAIAAGF